MIQENFSFQTTSVLDFSRNKQNNRLSVKRGTLITQLLCGVQYRDLL